MAERSMRMARIHGPGQVSLDLVPEPECGSLDVIVRVRRCGLCGSDIGYIGTGGVAAPATEPFGIGHELSGAIEAVGSAVVGMNRGMRATVNPIGNGIGAGVPEGAFAPLLRVAGATLCGRQASPRRSAWKSFRTRSRSSRWR